MKYPDWIVKEVGEKKRFFHKEENAIETDEDLKEYRANTICYEAKCPNKGKCFKEKHATFLILGTECTRNCKFCSVSKDKPKPPDPKEPEKIAKLVEKWQIKYVVFTSPTRDDLKDGGAEQFKETITQIKKLSPDTIIEPLIPDFKGNTKSLDSILSANPEVISHNIEMPERLYKEIRPKANYKRSLETIRYIKEKSPKTITKSSLIIGLGENMEEIKKTLTDIKNNLCDIIVIGQYLNPTEEHYPIIKFYSPKEFKEIENYSLQIGFKAVVSSPLARTSYTAYEAYKKAVT
ncbi:MAG TPA: lipoyl synthase [Elusimicrobiales bacterium]|nr:lipoyl synthase [Elusimicrobiales bacterium]HPO95738.1 lipoyl synthase [Elusimicrobiales bacterium]